MTIDQWPDRKYPPRNSRLTKSSCCFAVKRYRLYVKNWTWSTLPEVHYGTNCTASKTDRETTVHVYHAIVDAPNSISAGALPKNPNIGARMIFRLGSKNWFKKQSRHSNSKYNFMQYVFFKKGIRSLQWGLGLSPEATEFSRSFVLKVTLQSVRLLLTVSYKKIGEQDILTTNCSPIILLGEQLLPLLPRFPRLWPQTPLGELTSHNAPQTSSSI